MTPKEQQVIKFALEEDIGKGDLTTNAMIPQNAVCSFEMTAHQKMIVAGLGVVEECFQYYDPDINVRHHAKDGSEVTAGQPLMTLKGNARAIITVERTALNFIQKMSGVATLTRKFVDKVKPYGVKIFDTRKTSPGLRSFNKYAVMTGGGNNHRLGLFDGIMVKDNHKAVLKKLNMQLQDSVAQLRQRYRKKRIMVEADNLDEALEAARGGADEILLDNMSPKQIRIIVKELEPFNVIKEATGGVTLDNVVDYAKTGIDRISIGALTHSAPAVDIGLHFA